MNVCHDPGHGQPHAPGGSRGCEHNGVVERDWVLSLSRDVSAGVPWCEHHILREGPCGPTYAERAKVVKSSGANLLLIHHANSYQGKASGLIAFHFPGDFVGQEVAQAIANAAPSGLRRKQGVEIATPERWPRVRAVMDNYRVPVLPVVLIEWGFASDEGDAKILKSHASRPALVAAAFAGIARAFELRHQPQEIKP